jgi:4-hydroxythreonine-4-phosphate dehydrogenase
MKPRAPAIHVPIGITMGDPAGIGPEIVAKLAAGYDSQANPIVVIGDAGALARAARIVGADLAIHLVERPGDCVRAPAARRTVSLLQVGPPLPADLRVGCVDARAGAAAYAYVECAANLAMAGELAAIVTAPINKESLAASGIRHPGHTEILASISGAADVAMMLANDELRVLLVSIHLSLAEAIGAVTPESELRAIRLAHAACRAFGLEHPRVAVAGLNPHAGENGMFGREDLDIIVPAIERCRREGIRASGPWPGDTVFMRARRGEFDVVVAQYHDQGLIPVKYLGVDQGVNITVGLPFIRTSVDHGTAFDIAWKGKASHVNMRAAIAYARMMADRMPARVAA